MNNAEIELEMEIDAIVEKLMKIHRNKQKVYEIMLYEVERAMEEIPDIAEIGLEG